MGAEYPEKNTLKIPNIQPIDVHLIQCPDVRRKSTMHAQNLPVYQGGHSQKIKNLELCLKIDFKKRPSIFHRWKFFILIIYINHYLATIPPCIAVPVFVLALIIETIHLNIDTS